MGEPSASLGRAGTYPTTANVSRRRQPRAGLSFRAPRASSTASAAPKLNIDTATRRDPCDDRVGDRLHASSVRTCYLIPGWPVEHRPAARSRPPAPKPIPQRAELPSRPTKCPLGDPFGRRCRCARLQTGSHPRDGVGLVGDCTVRPARQRALNVSSLTYAASRETSPGASCLIMSAAFSAIIRTGALMLPPTRVGMIDASTTRSAWMPWTCNR